MSSRKVMAIQARKRRPKGKKDKATHHRRDRQSRSLIRVFDLAQILRRMPFLTQPSPILSGLGTGTGSALACVPPGAGVGTQRGAQIHDQESHALPTELARLQTPVDGVGSLAGNRTQATAVRAPWANH
ncbi:hypothetical protein PGIGA_G00257700 [Pangasianodon gigas]|uniref:Uncharacterized protein n=1 Tax=Pangasianodon gigas TaxID=30993 RepID=A0ACC5WSS9_PANGG|nr:hypothetical protein [Pangasianodon gigas]